jgi:BolA-like protein 1
MQRYKQLLFFATKLEPLPAKDRTPDNKVKGCVSQVWVVPHVGDEGRLYWAADSDSQLTKGLAALLVQGLSGCTPEEIVRIQPNFIAELGLQQSLTPSRNNGFLNMFKLMQGKALELMLQQQQAAGPSGASGATSAAAGPSGETADGASSSPGTSESASDGSNGDGGPNGASVTASTSRTPVADSMRRKLEAELGPLALDVVDESHKHAGHAGVADRPGGASGSGETHFTIEIVSAAFEGLSSLKRHRLVYKILGEEMAGPVHALSLVTKTPGEAGL